MKKFIITAVLAAIGLVGFTSPARADNTGVWTKLDLKVPVYKPSEDTNLRLRLTPEFAFTDDAGGLKQTVVRAGPYVNVNKWFGLTANFLSSTTNGKQDIRPEIQPEFTIKTGGLKINDRNRFSYKALNTGAGDRWQYANEIKAAVDIPSTRFNTFASWEPFYDFQKEKLIQHRLTGGFGHYINDACLFETGYLYRTSMGAPEWVKDHMLFIQFANR